MKRSIQRKTFILTAILIILILGGIYLFENGGTQEKSLSIVDTLWRAFVTTTTVGYGDVVIHNTRSKLFAVIYVIISMIILGEILKRVNKNIFISHHNKMTGMIESHAKNHTIIYGPDPEYAANLIQELVHEYGKEHDIVFIHQTPQCPAPIISLQNQGYDIDFICGSPANHETLVRSNIHEASRVIILKEKELPDQHTLGYITSMRLINSTIPLYCEIANPDHYTMVFLKAGATKVLDTTGINHQFITRSISDDVDIILSDMMTANEGYEIYKSPVETKRHTKTLRDIQQAYLDQNITIISCLNNRSAIISYDKATKLHEETDIYYLAKTRHAIL